MQKFILTILIFSIIVVYLMWDMIPGTLEFSDYGPTGTGEMLYTYKSGNVKLREWYYRGFLTSAEWFSPDGQSIDYIEYDKSNDARFHYLHDDGSLSATGLYRYDSESNSYILIDGTMKQFAMGTQQVDSGAGTP